MGGKWLSRHVDASQLLVELGEVGIGGDGWLVLAVTLVRRSTLVDGIEGGLLSLILLRCWLVLHIQIKEFNGFRNSVQISWRWYLVS